MKILIIDDNEAFYQTIKQTILLEDAFEDFQIDLSSSGEDALSLIDNYDIAITDYNLGKDKMTGLDIVQEVVKSFPTVPIIVLTAQGDMEKSVECYRAGAIDFVDKNMEHEVFILKAIHSAINFIEKNQAEDMKKDLQHILIHDLKTPLSGISSSLDIIKIKFSKYKIEDNRLDKLIGSCKLSCRQMEAYVNNILFLERNKGKIKDKQKFNLKECVSSICSLVEVIVEMNDLSFEFTYEGDECICSSEINIEHILFNILSNALQYTSSKDMIQVKIKNKDKTSFEIMNTGSVIPKGTEKKIFERDFTSHSSKMNHGLGLSFCKKAVEALGGTIEVSSDYKKNITTFEFEIPGKNSN